MNSGVINVLNKTSKNKVDKKELEKIINKRRAYDEVLIKGIFHNKENPRSATSLGMLRFTFKLYKGEPATTYELYDGEEYELPRGVVNHLNKNCYYVEHQKIDPKYGNVSQALSGRYLGTKTMTEVRKIHRFSFERKDRDDEPDFNDKIAIVEIEP